MEDRRKVLDQASVGVIRLWRFVSPCIGMLCSIWIGITGCQSPKPSYPPIHDLNSQSQLQRGRDLVEGFAACGFCHSLDGQPQRPLSGGRVFQDAYGAIQPGNITIDKSGIGEWGLRSVRDVFREAKRPDGSTLAPHAHKGFEWMSDRDIDGITAYLRYLPGSKSNVSRRAISFWNRNVRGFWETLGEVKGYIPETPQEHTVEYGRYIVDNVARCGACHNRPSGLFSSEKYLEGGKEISINGDFRFAPNITQSITGGIGAWTEQEMQRFLRTGQTPEGHEVSPKYCPVSFYSQAPEIDIQAVVSYLRTVKGDS